MSTCDTFFLKSKWKVNRSPQLKAASCGVLVFLDFNLYTCILPCYIRDLGLQGNPFMVKGHLNQGGITFSRMPLAFGD